MAASHQALVPQACITVSKTSLVPRWKTGYRIDLYHWKDGLNPSYCGHSRVELCFWGFPLCQRHHPTQEDFAVCWVMAVRGVASHKPSFSNGKGLWPLTLAQRVLLVFVIKLNPQGLSGVLRNLNYSLYSPIFSISHEVGRRIKKGVQKRETNKYWEHKWRNSPPDRCHKAYGCTINGPFPVCPILRHYRMQPI